jgi:Asp-tRNA(Asn)/Glu-tRNA(Gln) amidotransferase A subunit family amidase
MNSLRSIFTQVDVIVLPSTGVVAPRIDSESLSYGISDLQTTVQILKFAFLTNFTGNPAITCPVGYDSEYCLPVGFQIIGNWWDEDTVFQVARTLETWSDRKVKRPNLYFDMLNVKN